jgi:hypothetical protein
VSNSIFKSSTTEDKTDYVKDSFYKELERVFDKYHMTILLGDFNAKVGREDILKLTIGNETLHVISNDNEVRLVKFATSKNLRVKSLSVCQGRQQEKNQTRTHENRN